MAQRRRRAPPVDTAAARGLPEWVSLYQAYNAVFKANEQALLPHGITVPQLHLLSVLVSAGGVLPSTRIARSLVKEAQTITGLVDRMEAAGWLAREGAPKDRPKTQGSPAQAGHT